MKAISLINESKKIVCILGGGSIDAGKEVSKLVDNLGAVVITTAAGKGVINDNHPLVISGGTVRAEAREYLSKADLILSIGTEMAETDNYVGQYSINGKIVRIDIDDKKINDNYKATVGLVGDAKETVKRLNAKLHNSVPLEQLESARNAVIEIKRKIDTNLTKSEKRHKLSLIHI